MFSQLKLFLVSTLIFLVFVKGVFPAGDTSIDPKADATSKKLQGVREKLGVYMFSSSDYPAMFAIIGGLSVILIVAVVFIVVGLFTMEPAKDSIIYRMTTQRMKKD